MKNSNYTELLQIFEPADTPLFQLVCDRIDDGMLLEIAQADYHQDVEAHLAALTIIRSGNLGVPMRWEPKEVLELIRWSEPDDPTWQPGSVGERGHWLRLFCCVVLMCAAARPEHRNCYFSSEDSTIIQLVDSAISLGCETAIAALSLLCWRIDREEEDSGNVPYLAIAILLLSVSLDLCPPQVTDRLISIINIEETIDLELFEYRLKVETWQRSILAILLNPARSSTVRSFGRKLISHLAITLKD